MPELKSSSANSGFGLTTAKIIYHLPDAHDLLQEFVWQRFDVFPDFPTLTKFLSFWENEIEGPLHSVTIAHKCLLHPVDLAQLQRARLN